MFQHFELLDEIFCDRLSDIFEVELKLICVFAHFPVLSTVLQKLSQSADQPLLYFVVSCQLKRIFLREKLEEVGEIKEEVFNSKNLLYSLLQHILFPVSIVLAEQHLRTKINLCSFSLSSEQSVALNELEEIQGIIIKIRMGIVGISNYLRDDHRILFSVYCRDIQQFRDI